MQKPKSKYNSLKEWKKDFPVHYRDAKSQGHIEELCRIFGWDLPIIKEYHPRGYWDNKENCIGEAKKYKTISEWIKKSMGSYTAAKKYNWVDECKTHMINKRTTIVGSGYWNNKEICIEEAKKYKTRSEWGKKSAGSYLAAKRNGWFDECTSHMIRDRVKSGHWYVKENCIEEAKKYKTRTEWSKKSNTSYNFARKHDWFDECTVHMVSKRVKNGYWTKERCIEEAKKYKTRTEWQKNSSSSYGAARKHDWFDECIEHMIIKQLKNGYWQIKENVLFESKKYKTIKEWEKNSSSSYSTAGRNGWLDECTSHMIRDRVKNGYWTKERCIEEAKKYKTRTQWQKKSGGSYTTSLRNGWHDECTEHMVRKRVTKMMDDYGNKVREIY